MFFKVSGRVLLELIRFWRALSCSAVGSEPNKRRWMTS